MSMSSPAPAKAGFNTLSPYLLSTLEEAFPLDGNPACVAVELATPCSIMTAFVTRVFKGRSAGYCYFSDGKPKLDSELVAAIARFKTVSVLPCSREELLADPRMTKLKEAVKKVFEDNLCGSAFSVKD